MRIESSDPESTQTNPDSSAAAFASSTAPGSKLSSNVSRVSSGSAARC